jgi:RNA polymerase sigma factor (sigma-70 family)
VAEIRELVERARRGDIGAYGEIVRRFQDMACGYAYSVLGDFHAAEDAAQEAFVEAYRKLRDLREPAAFAGWLRRIVHKYCDRATRRKRPPTVPPEAGGAVMAEQQRPEEVAQKREIQSAVLEAISSLPGDERTATTLFYIDGYSQAQIAEFLEVPVTTVNGRLRTSRKRLKERMIKMVKDTLTHNAPGGEFGRKVLERIIRFPVRIMRRDGKGGVLGEEMPHPTTRHEPQLLGCLWCAVLMAGHDVRYEDIMMATGEGLRFAFDPTWGFEAEHVSPVDALGNFCDILGFEAEFLKNRGLRESIAVIEENVAAGIPVLMGFGRCWRVIVGFDREKREYYHIGGGWEFTEAGPGEEVSEYIEADECHRMSVPDKDWFSCVVGPEQFARNPVFLIKGRKAPDAHESIVKALRLAVEVDKARTIERAQLDLRRLAKPNLPPVDAEYFFGYEPGTFFTGTDAIRKWADKITTLKGPSHDFRVIHANDTTLGCQLERIDEVTRYLARLVEQFDGGVKRHLEEAHEACLAAGGGGDHPVPALRYWTCHAQDAETLQREIRENASMVYLVPAANRHLLGEYAQRAQECPWGLSVLPDQKTFETARDRAVAELHRIAEFRDVAIEAIAKVLSAAGAR